MRALYRFLNRKYLRNIDNVDYWIPVRNDQEYNFKVIKDRFDNVSDEDKLELLYMINDEYKVILRKEKIKKIK
jgi:L,D-peptidoglycan transpeptidase YkuD (ErfK/YbiS/YcfS/YnhG family)